jgi:ABC-type antimicrobial peptide transport system permease subunit
LGLAIAVAGTRILASMLFQVKPYDPSVYLGVTILLALVTLVAAYIPARRAADIDPLRQE